MTFYPTLLAAIGDVAEASWRASALGVYRFWRDLGYAVGALVAGVVADALGLSGALWLVAAITFASGLAAAIRMTGRGRRRYTMARVSSRRLGDSRKGAAMPFYRDRIYPRLVKALGDPEPIRQIRQRIVERAQGTVLEIGVGPGVNFVHYDPAKTTKILALEPNPGMRRLAQRERARTPIDITFLDLPGESLPLENRAVDTVLSTFTLCTIPGVSDAIKEMRRVLKPEGRLIFFEHGLSPDPRIERWQRWTEPIPHWLFEGCHVTRDIPALIEQGGFRIEEMEKGYLAPFPKSWTYTWWGSAAPAA